MLFGFRAGVAWLVPRDSHSPALPLAAIEREDKRTWERSWDWLKWCVFTGYSEQGKHCKRCNFTCFEGWQRKPRFLAFISFKQQRQQALYSHKILQLFANTINKTLARDRSFLNFSRFLKFMSCLMMVSFCIWFLTWV